MRACVRACMHAFITVRVSINLLEYNQELIINLYEFLNSHWLFFVFRMTLHSL